MKRSLRILAMLAAVSAAPVHAATITMSKIADTWPLITLSGPLELKDADTFMVLADQVHPTPEGTIHIAAIVSLDGPGGSVAAAIQIGNYIRDHNWNTIVPADKSCLSACGLIWLGGNHRTLDVGAHVGFHSAYDLHGADPVANVGANAIIGSYMGHLGLSYDAIYYLTNTAPTSMQILQDGDSQKYGISYGRPATPQLLAPKPPMQIAPRIQQQAVEGETVPLESSCNPQLVTFTHCD